MVQWQIDNAKATYIRQIQPVFYWDLGEEVGARLQDLGDEVEIFCKCKRETLRPLRSLYLASDTR